MRASDPPVQYLAGTPKGRLTRYEADLLEQPWQKVREGVKVKLHAQDGEMFVYARSRDRVAKEPAMRLRQLRGLLRRLRELSEMALPARELLLKLGEARERYRTAWRLMLAKQMLDVHFPATNGRTLILSRYTQPEADQKIFLEKLNLHLPEQPPPHLSATHQLLTSNQHPVVKTF